MTLSNIGYCKKAIELKKQTESSFLILGGQLLKIRDEKLFLGHWDSFSEYLEEMSLIEGTASKLINIYKKFILEYNIEESRLIEAGGWTKLASLLSIISSKEEAEEWLDKSSVLSVRDLQKEITESVTKVEMRKCKHKDTYTIRICRDCGDREEIVHGTLPEAE